MGWKWRFIFKKKSKMLEIINNHSRSPEENEDVFFTKTSYNLKIPNVDTANRFSNEKIYSQNSFGVHKPWNYLTENEIKNKEKNVKV